MAALPIDRVHLGFWRDYSQSYVNGATITVHSSTANLVVAFLAIVVVVGGGAWWELMSFALFSISSRGAREKPIVLDQTLALLRNLGSPGSFLLEALRLLYVALSRPPRTFTRRLSPILLLTVLISFSGLSSLGFIAAGVFVSSVVSTESINVLAQSNACGFTTSTSSDGASAEGMVTQEATLAWQFSQTCSNSSASLPQCGILAGKMPPVQIADGPPPFPDAHIKDGATLVLDSGLINSRTHLGINTAEEDIVSFRIVKSCSILDNEKYMKVSSESDFDWTLLGESQPTTNRSVFAWFFGAKNSEFGAKYGTSIVLINETSSQQTDYEANGLVAFDQNDDPRTQIPQKWFMIPELNPPSADVSINGISARNIRYQGPVDDPFFAAHNARTERLVSSLEGEFEQTLYLADSVYEWMACAEQYQYCFGPDRCTSLAGTYVADVEGDGMSKTQMQNATFYALAARGFTLGLNGVETQHYLAPQRLQNGISAPLDPDWWKIELKSWFDWTLAILQTEMPYFAIGDDVAYNGNDFVQGPPANDGERALCHAQKMKAPVGISNISVVSLAVTVSVAGFFFLLDLLLIPLLRTLTRRGILDCASVRRWDQAGVLQLQRKVYQANGWTEWERCDKTVPRYVGPEAGPAALTGSVSLNASFSTNETDFSKEKC